MIWIRTLGLAVIGAAACTASPLLDDHQALDLGAGHTTAQLLSTVSLQPEPPALIPSAQTADEVMPGQSVELSRWFVPAESNGDQSTSGCLSPDETSGCIRVDTLFTGVAAPAQALLNL